MSPVLGRFKTEQQLSDGIWIQQNLYRATRYVLFRTNDEHYSMASYDGTLLVFDIGQRLFAITARHVAGKNDEAFSWADLIVPRATSGKIERIPIKTVYHPQSSSEEGEFEFYDLVIVELAEDSNKITDRYIWREDTISSVEPGDELRVQGYAGIQSKISADAHRVFAEAPPCEIQCYFSPAHHYGDITLFTAISSWNESAETNFGSLKGFSGSPVFNVTKNKLCGMVVRAGRNCVDETAKFHFLSAETIHELLITILDGRVTTDLNFTYWVPSNH